MYGPILQFRTVFRKYFRSFLLVERLNYIINTSIVCKLLILQFCATKQQEKGNGETRENAENDPQRYARRNCPRDREESEKSPRTSLVIVTFRRACKIGGSPRSWSTLVYVQPFRNNCTAILVQLSRAIQKFATLCSTNRNSRNCMANCWNIGGSFYFVFGI